MFFEKHFVPVWGNYSQLKWREEFTFCEPVDNFLKAYYPFLQHLWKIYGQVHVDRNEQGAPFLTLSDTGALFSDSSIAFDNLCTKRDFGLFFNLCQKTVVDETNDSNHMRCDLAEFLELFCRVVEKASPGPNSFHIMRTAGVDQDQSGSEESEVEVLSEAQRRA